MGGWEEALLGALASVDRLSRVLGVPLAAALPALVSNSLRSLLNLGQEAFLHRRALNSSSSSTRPFRRFLPPSVPVVNRSRRYRTKQV